jgi:hypothetical protein
VDLATAAGSIFAALGLSGAAGLNAWIPVFATALLARLGVIDLADPYDQLTSNLALILLGAALVLDFVGDKVPVVDSVLHTAGTVVHPLAGAVVFAGQTGLATDIPPAVAWLAGAAVAGTLHGGRAAVRPVSTAGTAGTGNPLLSGAEDLVSGALTVLALIAPAVAFVLVLALLAALAVVARRVLMRRRA